MSTYAPALPTHYTHSNDSTPHRHTPTHSPAMSSQSSLPLATIPTTAEKPTQSIPVNKNENLPAIYWTVRPFVLGGISACFAQTIIQPIDMIKTRTQLAGEGSKMKVSPVAVAKAIVKQDGFMSLYRGLSAGYLRQVTYGVGRLGLFRTFSDAMQARQDKQLGVRAPMPFYVKMLCGSVAGGFGSILGTPADVALVRMQADSMLPMAERRNYRNGFHAMTSILKSEGVSGMFSGCAPTVARAMVQNAMMLGCYEQAKEFYNARLGQKPYTNFIASVNAGLAACCVSLPFDFMKSRMQKQVRRPDGTYPYSSMLDVARKTVASEGPLALYKGFTMYVIRIAPHSIITLCTLDFLVDKLKAKGM